MPIEATATGFVIWDIKNKERLTTELSYDDAYDDKFNFWEEDAEDQADAQLQNCLSFLGVNAKMPDEALLNDMLIQHGTVSIPLSVSGTVCTGIESPAPKVNSSATGVTPILSPPGVA